MTTALKDVLLVGFGAVGVIYAHILKRSGLARVTAVARSNFASVSRDGMHIESLKYGDIPHWRPDRLFPSLSEALDRPYEYVFVATKALSEISPTSKLLAPLLSPPYAFNHPQPVYVLLQNGLGVERDLYAAALEVNDLKRNEGMNVQPPRILSTAVWIGTNLLSDNVLQHNDFDRITIGLYKPGKTFPDSSQSPEEIALLKDIGEMLEAGGSTVTLTSEIQHLKFRKNFWNLAFASFSTLARHPLPAIFQVPEVEARVVPVIRAVLLEALAVGRAMGFDEDALPAAAVDDTIELTARIHRLPDSKHRASMLLDAENGRPLEVEVIVGEVVRSAHEHGVEVPRIETLYALLSVVQGQLAKRIDSA